MVYHKTEKQIKEDTDKIIKQIDKRGHVFIEGEYRNRDSTLIVYCPLHDEIIATTFHNYSRSKTGLDCCGKQLVREKLKDRKFSAETLQKMIHAALKRPSRGGKPRRWREHPKYWDWRNKVRALYNYQCAITGKQPSDSEPPLEVHHLYSVSGYPDLVYQVENGILLTKELHMKFHSKHHYGKNTIGQFQTFLTSLLTQTNNISMPISSQANLEELEGSETSSYDPERVMKFYERLEKLNQSFNQE